MRHETLQSQQGKAEFMRRVSFLPSLVATGFLGAVSVASAQRTPLAPGVEQVCAIDFSKDAKRPARVEDSALPCIERAANKLKTTSNIKLVLVGVSHPLYDHADEDRGMEREGEDMTGADIRFSDIAAYRA